MILICETCGRSIEIYPTETGDVSYVHAADCRRPAVALESVLELDHLPRKLRLKMVAELDLHAGEE